jgi:hypothetical protein
MSWKKGRFREEQVNFFANEKSVLIIKWTSEHREQTRLTYILMMSKTSKRWFALLLQTLNNRIIINRS